MAFHYDDGSRVPFAMSWNGHPLYLFYDQVGSLRVIADEQGNVIKEIRYDSFGRIVEDSNPAMMAPLGFAGGLHDRDNCKCDVIQCLQGIEFTEWKVTSESLPSYHVAAVLCWGAACKAAWKKTTIINEERYRLTIIKCDSERQVVDRKREVRK